MGTTYNGKFIEGYIQIGDFGVTELSAKEINSFEKVLLDDEMKEEYGYSAARLLFCYLWVENKIIPFVQSYVYRTPQTIKGRELRLKSTKIRRS